MAELLDNTEKGLPLADGTVQALAHLLAGTLRDDRPEPPALVRRSALDLAQGLGIDPAATLAEAEATLRTALGMPPREGLPDCNACGQFLGIADGQCTSCAATAMLTTVLHPEQALGLEDDDDDEDDEDGDWDDEEDYEDE